MVNGAAECNGLAIFWRRMQQHPLVQIQARTHERGAVGAPHQACHECDGGRVATGLAIVRTCAWQVQVQRDAHCRSTDTGAAVHGRDLD
jgi:hypothetical protein